MQPTRRASLGLLLAAVTSIWLVSARGPAPGQPEPTELPELDYDRDFFPGPEYDPAVPQPEECLGFELGSRAAFPHEIESCLAAWAEASERAHLEEYARSHEGRALYTMVLTSPANHARLDEIRAGWARLADPRGVSREELSELVDALPAVAWMAYSIHGDETSGSDAALAVVHHLAAGRGPAIEALLEELVMVIDPMQNPDGRNRFLQMIAEHRSAQPNLDDQSLIHGGYWPWGRTNHYGFDLNRDWILGVNPESRGRIRAAGDWNQVLMVDAHEMGSQNTYLFSPQREPHSPFVSAAAKKWGPVFADDQAATFDERGWVYYTGEWNEGWYAGYTDAWGELRGVVGILYEQAGFAEDGVRRPEGTIHTYREAVHHQAISSLANLETLRANAGEIKRAFLADRLAAVDPRGPWADRTFAVLPTANRGRLDRFLDLMRLQGIELYTVDEPLVADSAVDQLGRRQRRVTVPAGSVLIPNRQPLARLVAAMLEFDPRMPDDYLRRERKQILRTGDSSIYDVTAWNLTMMHGLAALSLDAGLPASAT
ncbi:MAG: M14 family zinc carboxypeptidase, partial [Thermoanaerobaculia bacterium]